MNFIYWVLHIFNCPDKYLTLKNGNNKNKMKCLKCGREFFIVKQY